MKKNVANANTEANETVVVETEATTTKVDLSTMTKAQKEALAKRIRAIQNGGVIRKGRAIDPDSKRQHELAKKSELRAAGLLKKGRPAYTAEQKAEADKVKEAKREAEIAAMDALAAQLLESGDVESVLSAIK
jgi:hypothetical protein